MKSITALKTTQFVCAVLFIVSILPGLNRIFGFADFSYANSDKYTAGDAEINQPVHNLTIDWASGKVDILYHNKNTVILSEKSKKTISPEMQMRWWLDGDTLRIQYAKPGIHLNQNLQKELTVTLPKDILLDDVNINATSGILTIPILEATRLSTTITAGEIFATVKAQDISCQATSGEIYMKVLEDTEEISASATSGNITIEAEGCETLQASSTSGSIHITAEKARILSAVSTSGGVYADLGVVKDMTTRSTSGDIQIKIAALEKLKASSTSGSVKAALPEDPGFKANLDSTSGRITCSLSLIKQGSDYICGDGSGAVDISTTSGNITIKALKG